MNTYLQKLINPEGTILKYISIFENKFHIVPQISGRRVQIDPWSIIISAVGNV